ncbi:MAG TPA: hypothetical protein VL475_02055 [Planctomycetaceae bacterium]|nr:hypothetical protein [Planctomycetaceae bacterium]
MPHRLFIVLIASLASVATSSLAAEDKSPGPQLGGRLARIREESREIPSAEVLIFKRAHRRAEQRAARLEMYHWMGYSPNRPMVPYTTYANDLNAGLYKPWVTGFYSQNHGW